MPFTSLQALLDAQLEETEREYSDISELSEEDGSKLRQQEYANWIEENRDYYFQLDVKAAIESIEKINAMLHEMQTLGLPLPQMHFQHSESGRALAYPILAELQTFDVLQRTFAKLKESHGIYRSMGDDCILLTIQHVWNQDQGLVNNLVEKVLLPVWTIYHLTVRMEEFKRTLLQTDTPKPAPKKRLKLLEEERIWRMNYYLRVYYNNIPKRDDMKDKSAFQTLYDLWTRNEAPTKEQTEAIKAWDALQERRAKAGERTKGSRARAVRGQWFVVKFNQDYGLLYNEEVDGPDHENDFANSKSTEHYHEMVRLLDETSLMYPISANALPAPVELEEKQAEIWQRKCPPWMSTWSHKLVKHERQSFIMF